MDNSQLLARREKDCFVERRAFEMWLGKLTPLKWLVISAGTLLPLVASAKVFGVLGPGYALVSGLCALVASALTGLHAAFHCDEHQAECRRLISLYASLQFAFQAARTLPEAQVDAKLRELEVEFESAKRNSKAAPSHRLQERAERQAKGNPDFASVYAG
jgi:hypothetical protein